MSFDLINLLVFSSGEEIDIPSDLKFYHLKRQAKEVVDRIDEAEKHLEPYLKKLLIKDKDGKIL